MSEEPLNALDGKSVMMNDHLDTHEAMDRKILFNETGDVELAKRRMIGGNTTNINDFNNVKYLWANNWYRQAMNNFWIPEEINMATDVQQYRELSRPERTAYDKILSFLIFLDSIQTNNVPFVGQYITANEVVLCLTIQAYQEAIHSQAYSYMLDTICSPDERSEILYQWRDDEHLLGRNRFIGDLYMEFQHEQSPRNLVRSIMGNYILEGIYFYSGFMFFYSLGRINKMPGSVQQIRYINRDENVHLWLFRSIISELRNEYPELFTPELVEEYRAMIKEGCEQEIAWGKYVIGNDIPGLNETMVEDYIKYLGNLRCQNLNFEPIYEGHREIPDSMSWIDQYSAANLIKTDFFEAKSTAYSKSTAMVDDL